MPESNNKTTLPSYRFENPNEDTILDKGIVSTTVAGKKFHGRGSAVLELVPRSAIVFRATFRGIPAHLAIGTRLKTKETISFEYKGNQIDGFTSGLGGNVPNLTWNLNWHPYREGIQILGDDETSIERIVFHLFNFKDFIGSHRALINTNAQEEQMSYS